MKRKMFITFIYRWRHWRLEKLNDFPMLFCQHILTKCLGFILSPNQMDNRWVEWHLRDWSKHPSLDWDLVVNHVIATYKFLSIFQDFNMWFGWYEFFTFSFFLFTTEWIKWKEIQPFRLVLNKMVQTWLVGFSVWISDQYCYSNVYMYIWQ